MFALLSNLDMVVGEKKRKRKKEKEREEEKKKENEKEGKESSKVLLLPTQGRNERSH